MDSTTIAQMILKGLPDAEVTVSGDDGVHFEAVVRSPRRSPESQHWQGTGWFMPHWVN